jgi:hypothetical protein
MRAYVRKQKEEARIRAFSRLTRWGSQSPRRDGGEGGIRTHEPGFARLPAFEAGSFNRSDTSPQRSIILATTDKSHKRTKLRLRRDPGRTRLGARPPAEGYSNQEGTTPQGPAFLFSSSITASIVASSANLNEGRLFSFACFSSA